MNGKITMKKTIYMVSFIVFGILLQFLIHAGLEIWYIDLLTNNFDLYGLGLCWRHWYGIHHFLTVLLLIGGIIFGFQQGKFWWKRLYEKK